MHTTTDVETATAGQKVGEVVSFREKGAAKLQVLHRQMCESLPQGTAQEVRVLRATLEPGDVTPRHFHRHPVTLFMLDGTFTLDLEDRGRIEVKAGEVFIEPAHVAMTGHNYDAKSAAQMVLFCVSDADTPFADPIA